MTDFQAQATVSLIGILLSGIVGTVISHRFAAHRADKELRRQKIELAVLSVARYEKFLQSLAVTYLFSLDGKFAQEIFDKAVTANKDKEHYEQCSMLFNVYFPDLVPLLDQFSKTGDSLSNLGIPLMTGKQKMGPEHSHLIQKQAKSLQEVRDAIFSELYKEAKKLR